jgi:hypothetical protein
VEAVLPAGLWEATERGGEGDEAPDLDAIDGVDPTQIGTPGGPKLRWAGCRSSWGDNRMHVCLPVYLSLP